MIRKQISLIVPVRNERESIRKLIESIINQTLQPAEIILIDGGSIDDTVKIIKEIIENQPRFRLIEAGDATPGRGRNIGIENAQNEWIALTDAGIVLEKDWLENLVKVAEADSSCDVIYGNFAPSITSLFEKCAAITYVQPKRENKIRGKFIASSLIKKSVWEKVGGFPDLRAAEDLTFMEAVEKEGFKAGYAPAAAVHWQLQPDWLSTYHKFVLYSKHNVLAKREWDWHYGLLKNYIILLPFLLLTLLHSWWWLIAIIVWISARSLKRILINRYEFGLLPIFNPIYFFTIISIIIVIDLATLIGWIRAKNQQSSNPKLTPQS